MNYLELWEFVKSDDRAPNEIFNELCRQMQELSGGSLDEREAIEAVRNLAGFCETIMGLGNGSSNNP